MQPSKIYFLWTLAICAVLAGSYSMSAFSDPIHYPAATDEPMRFELITLSDADLREIGPWNDLIIGNNRDLIVANGQIYGEGEAPGILATSETFRQFLDAHPVAPGTMLMVESGGGNLYDSFLIGQLVRKAGLRTSIVPNSECASACNFLFMGGTVRTMEASTLFMVHRFAPKASEKEDSKLSEENAQQISGLIATYLKEMGIDSEFLVQMSQIPNDYPTPIPRDRLEQLGVLNSGATTTWSEGADKGVFVLDAITSKPDTVGSPNHLGLLCDGGKLTLRAIYFPSANDYLQPLGTALEGRYQDYTGSSGDH
jgi:ATP-dependent protease ClpP protease subunit